MSGDASTPTGRPIIPLIQGGAATARRLRRRSLANLACMGHCAPTVMQTLLEESGVEAPWLVKASGGLPGGIGNIGEECGGVTAPLMLLGLRHAHDPLDRGLPVVVYRGHDLLRRFTECHGTALCREIRGNDRLPMRCVGVVRRAPEGYIQTAADPAADVIPEQSRQAFGRLYAHFVERGFHCAQPVLAHLRPTVGLNEALGDALSGFIGGTVFTGRTCGALTAGVVALGATVGTIERSRLRVLRMIGLMAVGGDAFADKYNAFNKTMNLGHRLSRWFAAEFGSTQCHAITQCDFSTTAGASQYITSDTVRRCRVLPERVALKVDHLIEHAPASLDPPTAAKSDGALERYR
jgi:hypothetical protein